MKSFAPRVISLSSEESISRNVRALPEKGDLSAWTLYIGVLSDAVYRFRSLNGTSLLLINDGDIQLDRLKCGNNTVLVFPSETDPNALSETCREYLETQAQVIEKSHRMMDAFLADSALQNTLDSAAVLIGNPLMAVDNSYRVVGTSAEQAVEDLQWMDSIRKGVCSYEFISQFNRVSEIETLKEGDTPVVAGCLVSPMRRCICKLYVDKKPVGYLLSIESEHPFSEVSVELLDVAGRFVSKAMAMQAMELNRDIIHTAWDAVINAIEGVPGSEASLEAHLKSAGLRSGSRYYLMLIALGKYRTGEDPIESIYQQVRAIFPLCVFSYYKQDAVVIVDFDGSPEALCRLLEDHREGLAGRGLHVTVSDPFSRFADVRRCYCQAKRAQQIMESMGGTQAVCAYEQVRIPDMLLAPMDMKGAPLFIREKELALYHYDQENGTEYYCTLYSYILHSRRLQDVSDALHIHKNTVNYRVKRVKELFDFDLDDAQVRLGLFLSFQALTLMEKQQSEAER